MRRNGINSYGRTLETDYLFTTPTESVRMGLPVRVTSFDGIIESHFVRGRAN